MGGKIALRWHLSSTCGGATGRELAEPGEARRLREGVIAGW